MSLLDAPALASDDTAATSTTTPTTAAATDSSIGNSLPDLVCFAHLHWDFVWQRPQHLLSRFAKHTRVFYVEEPCTHFDDLQMKPWMEVKEREAGKLKVVVAHLPGGLSEAAADKIQSELLTNYFKQENIHDFVAWYYSPMFLAKSRHLKPFLTIYDCMDELANFKGAHPELRSREQELFKQAQLVFTGGQSLYEAKTKQHHSAHAFPSSIDKAHFGQARTNLTEPADQKDIAHPRVGFFGVVDERLDIELLGQLATAHPEWQFVIIGPVVKIDPASLPQSKNIHYLGGKDYKELPTYLHGWDVATLLFADNESTKFISPTKTPEYLAAGKPVVSTPIRDVVRPYGELGLVHIAADADAFGKAISLALDEADDAAWLQRVDAYLATISWDQTWQGMVGLMQAELQKVAAR
ncbi:glycosyltransferase family 1 protein [Hymenobacter busanensis]|uniref:Glycosyltransferase family 1 protein n=1 Tax=Hymenobacter busanensis TaxID=2607656 RepID=A0A7L4ZZJ6_9BACT|nr:glycosyltransferase family 1 protein [Hymenobacter busanensis]KAA9338621.1 glycosyltransferase family 1 protein [Hymenobacter busanensis]QHJ08949.1 glycosyltransferase [Hymenobacter busanensis]